MARLYPPWAIAIYRPAIVLLLAGAAGSVLGPMIYVRTPYNTSQLAAIDQPVEFDHRHHVQDDGIECLYCHSSAERSANAGVPTTGVCMGCHNQIWNDSPLLEPVRRSYFSGQPIKWRRVHDLPDFTYFHHGVHVRAGVACESCHGDVRRMARVVQSQPLTMGWCLDCHREAAERVPQRSAPESTWAATVDLFTDSPGGDRSITGLTTCTACHR
jgi:Cytochrome c7 and related cytochrome c